MEKVQNMQAEILKENSVSGSDKTPNPHRKKRMDIRSILRNSEMQAAILSGVLMLSGWAVSYASPLISIILYILSYAAGGWLKAKEGVETLIKERELDVNLLMVAAAIGAASIGYWSEGAMLIFIFALSGALESYTMERSKKDISSLMALKPELATRIEDGKMTVVPIDELKVKDLILVKPGELIPSDGMIKKGFSSVNQASITGESVPVDKVQGDEVFAGTLNGEGVLYVEVTKSADATIFAKIIRMVEEAENEVPQSERFMKRFEAIYALVVVAVTLVIIFASPFIFGWSFGSSFYKAMVFLVVASPCALVASIMPPLLSAISNRARRGILFKGGAHMENMALTSVVAFDKTGTLTAGEPVVTDLIAVDGYDSQELLAIIASIEQLSEHPLAKAIVRKAEAENLKLLSAESVTSVTGWGMEGRVDGRNWRIGKTDVLDQMEQSEETAYWKEQRSRLGGEGKTVSLILEGERIVGLIGLQDVIRPQAVAAVQKLQAIGVKVAMLTGDRSETAQAIGRHIGVDYIYSDLLPEEKVEYVKRLREEHGHVVMVGDGVNDAPALATATVGMGMGMSGSGTALEVADVVLMNDNIEEIASTISLARRARRIVKQNMTFAITVIVLLMTTNFVAGIALPFGVVGHEGSTILVILNALRLLR
ncbi:heavy metal translocating P-type ATPase [Paenibacillus sp.]|jgi:Cd2+/Zn2+-exporting ATPase|uniref:heavy metal translocating P-type ATPase n=1 Tax=Paenibacillus sp. TaxID=58172 RepID=UPI0028235778|nr:heavy metal translocating P-type ATPase [Paenibacillus sp.]MDR0270774.1 cadmium-translocating P-type ATPase [Paenibacillus sp.]